ncbi:citXG protein [Erysipelothrix sp. HDW6C]|uniref:citrate lyase holo-[acyl-carrier protein] synthase n=1 Tax=Erysipelothrix sp. HDW6C TaxID=2714930 RepID=UPI00140A0812|nr:citrate lyase holo-[acyl-carrier protein] synthase [Erysipelothrix sp. HDW6C]QIK70423.1 citXG protein [Erysipelothrix sp. HDW6C]
MNIVQLTSESIRELRAKRNGIMKGMIEGQSGSLLVLGGSFAGDDRQRHVVSYAVFTIFFELWERFNMESWSYTYDAEGLIFYVKLEEDAKDVKDILVHYEDHHPIGFAIDSDVFDSQQKWSRESLGMPNRMDDFTKSSLDELMNDIVEDPKYIDNYIKRVEGYIVKGDKQTILSNILVYGYVSGFTKEMGFGMYGPNYKGSNEQMNFEKFIHLVRTYKDEIHRIFTVNSNSASDIARFQTEVENKIQRAVLNQQSYQYTVFMTSIVMFAFINSRGYADITKQIKKLGESFAQNDLLGEEPQRYDILKNGMREVFNQYVPFLQKSKSITSTLLYIMSRHDDQAILGHNGEQALLKVQFLAKNLIHKEDKWIELDKFCSSIYVYPHDDTTLLVVTSMLDIMQRYYLKIKMLFDTQEK